MGLAALIGPLQALEERHPLATFDEAIDCLVERGVAGRSRQRAAELLRAAIAEGLCLAEQRLALEPEADRPQPVTLVRLNYLHPLVRGT